NAAYQANAGFKIAVNQWTHVVFTVQNGTVKLYINGELKFTGADFPNTFTNNNAIFTLGVNYWEDAPYKGLIDELKIYNNVLTPEKVQAEYQQYGK
ncbi:LamG domain-containing protein, partial [Paenibacillus ihuae]|uniref:LamG domain-containing protein n=1 Tax=Paenibacillus ihuae TaxID=1232431 RepID=UPI0011DDCD1C